MKRRDFLFMATAATCSLSGFLSVPAAAKAGMTVYKDPNCGCCGAWASAMEAAGFSVTVEDVDDLGAVKRRFAVPAALEGCHTATIGGYVVEGHVPLEAVQNMLRDRPTISGIAVAGMPVGSLGMGVDPNAAYDVVAFRQDGSTDIVMQVRPKA